MRASMLLFAALVACGSAEQNHETSQDVTTPRDLYTLATAPQITRALRGAKGDWVSLNDA